MSEGTVCPDPETGVLTDQGKIVTSALECWNKGMKPFLVIALSVAFMGVSVAGSIVSSSEAKQHVGEKDIGVAGFVTKVFERSGNMYVSFRGDRPGQQFIGFIPQNNIEAAGGILFLNNLPGQFVALTGKIQKQNSGAKIVVLEKKQFLVAQ